MFNIKQKRFTVNNNDWTDIQTMQNKKIYLKRLIMYLKAIDLVIHFAQLTKWLKLYNVCHV